MEVLGVRFNNPKKQPPWILSIASIVLAFGEDKLRIADIIVGKHSDSGNYFIKFPTHKKVNADGTVKYYPVAHTFEDTTYHKIYDAIVSKWKRKEAKLNNNQGDSIQAAQ